jgi:hypothetical protein
MTCEVAVANRLGIALAADSAVTFTDGSAERTTYASGANKIFQLAEFDPVGVMVYNDATLNRVPWELILKTYRRELGGSKFDALQQYGDDLVDFLNVRALDLLPTAVREWGTTRAVQEAFYYAFFRALQKRPVLGDPNTSRADHTTAWAEAVVEIDAEFSAAAVDPSLDPADMAVALQVEAPKIAAQVPGFLGLNHSYLDGVVDPATLAKWAVEAAFTKPEEAIVTYSGVVIAGYGAKEYLPGFMNLRICGFIGRRAYWSHTGSQKVNYTDVPSLIEPFARKSMVETFTQGASPEVWKSVREAFEKHAAVVAKAAAVADHAQVQDLTITQAVKNELSDFTKSWAYALFGAHLAPLRSVIAGLNIEELAELAETLVMLESLKEKVTSRTQAVGGPIDVAVITRAEGLVWIKRKHYFNPSLNQRYFHRLQQPK